MFGEYIAAGQGTTESIRLPDGGTIRVATVDGDSPYILGETPSGFSEERAQQQALTKLRSELKNASSQLENNRKELDRFTMYLYGSLAVNAALLGYVLLKK